MSSPIQQHAPMQRLADLQRLSDEALSQQIMLGLYDNGLFQTWYRHRPEGWTLVSGLWSPIYLQLRELASYPDLLSAVGEALSRLIRRDIPETDCLVGVAFAGIPLAVAASLASGIPAAMTRKIAGRDENATQQALQSYGQHATVEGRFTSNSRLVLIDDLVTRFDSKLTAAQQVRHEVTRRGLENVTCEDVVVLIDREQGAAGTAAARGFRLRAMIGLPSQGLEWLRPRLADAEYAVLRAYFDDPAPFQAPDEQARLAELTAAPAQTGG
jgi:uridine monophosphate synthetase